MILAVGTALILGMLAPDPRMRVIYNTIVAAFCLSLAVALATVLALIPSPPDFRLRRRVRDDSEADLSSSEKPAERYTGYGHPVFTRPLPEPEDHNPQK